ncbi:MAG: prepilin peptidase [bacterium]|nr:prepilin peptidase [bacterium]
MFFIFLIGLVVGSFLNVLIFRLPRREGFTRGRSRCPSCGHVLIWKDLFPLISFLFLKRKCRFCSKKISWRYFLVELLTAIVFLGFFMISKPDSLLLFWPFSLWLAIICLLIVLVFIDFDYFIIPDKILVVTVLLALLLHLTNYFDALFANFLTGAISGAVFLLIFLATKGEKMGLGDVKLMALLGFIFGFPGILPVFYLAVAGALLWSIILILFFGGKLQTKLPFGTLLSGSAVVYILFHELFMPFLSPYLFRLYI